MAVYRTVTVNATLSDNTVQAEGTVSDEIARVTAVSQSVRTVESSDYAFLTNKPSINGIELVGDKTSAEIGVLVRSDTTANWESASGFIPQKGEVIVYEDYQTKTYTVEEYGEEVTRTVNIPAIKIGTGNAYVQDLAFVSEGIRDTLINHINNAELHTTLGEKTFWNNKININDSSDMTYGVLDDETLILNRN